MFGKVFSWIPRSLSEWTHNASRVCHENVTPHESAMPSLSLKDGVRVLQIFEEQPLVQLCRCRNQARKAWESIVKRICKTYICLSVTIFFHPFNPVALIMGILLNSSFMLYRTGKRQHRSGHMKNWSPAHRVAVKIGRIRIVIMTVSLVATTAFIGHLKQFYSGWVQRYPQRLHNPQ